MSDASSERYDAVVIGSGQGGGPLARDLAGAGRRTALIERQHVGGTCVNVGCTPTKTMVASARVAYLTRRAGDYGVEAGDIGIAMQQVRQRKRDIVESFRGGSERGIERTDGLDLVRGEASFSGPRQLSVRLEDGGELRVEAEQVFINTGCRPRRPPLEGLGAAPSLDSTSIMELGEVPEHLVIIGGGYIGVEFGQMFRRFGSRVTIVQRADQLLTNEDDDIAEAVAEVLRDDGIELLLETKARQVESSDGEIRLTVDGGDGGDGEHRIEGTHLLVAAGRVPNTDALDAERAGVELDDSGFVEVNDRLETTAEGVWALGDVKGGPMFTHISYDDYRIVRDNLLKGRQSSIEGRIVPYTVFMDPELGRVGLTESQARERGHDVRVAKMPMSSVARALETDETRGVMKAVVDAETERILGCAILGIQGGELASMIQIAMLGDLPFTALREGVFSHPTLAESLNTLFDSFEE